VQRQIFRPVKMDEQQAPLVIAVFGPPGGGKGTLQDAGQVLAGSPYLDWEPLEIVCTRRKRSRSGLDRHDGVGKLGPGHSSA